MKKCPPAISPPARRSRYGAGKSVTVVMTYDGTAFEIEFSDAQGRAFAILPIPTGKLMLLHDAPAAIAA